MRVYVEAFGCAQNLGEAEALKDVARENGHTLVASPSDAEVGLLVTCAVIGTTEEHMVERWRQLSDQLPNTIVTGCMVPLRRARLVSEGGEGGRGRTHLLPIRAQERLPDLLRDLSGPTPSPYPLDRAPAGPSAQDRGLLQIAGPEPPSSGPVHRELVLAQGCTSHCSYCFSRLARGPLKSTPLPRLLASARLALRAGAVELRLSSLDTSCWGEDWGEEGPRLPDLLREVDTLPSEQDFRVRVGMMSPQTLERFAPQYFTELGRLRHPFHFLHLPVQSGSDRVLEGMRRGYTAATFRRLVSLARDLVPELTLSTDVIVGFPGETEADHEATLRLVEEVEPEILNVTRFSPRPLTPAARLTPLVSRVVKERSRELTRLRLRLARARMERWVGRQGRAVVTEHGPQGTSVARLSSYIPVVLPERLPLRTWTEVVVHGARSTYLLGEVVPGTFLGGRPTP